MISRRLTAWARQIVTAPVLDWLWTPLTRSSVPILMLHRFEDREAGNAGFAADTLARQLALLRRRGFTPLRLADAIHRLARGEPIERACVFTVDDGYRDFYDVAMPVFAAAGVPVTVFLTTGFLDGRVWMWWDRVTTIFTTTPETSLRITIGGRQFNERWSGIDESRAVGLRITEWLKTLPEETKETSIDELARSLSAAVPSQAPEGFRPMSWEMVRRAAAHGVTFGPHTVTHPILARCSDQQARFEIEESWRRLQAEVPEAAIRVFCYPNGRRADQGVRESSVLAELGFEAAVTTRPGRVRRETVGSPQQFEMPRFSHPASDSEVLQIVSGLDRD